jgi:hypothetical protein
LPERTQSLAGLTLLATELTKEIRGRLPASLLHGAHGTDLDGQLVVDAHLNGSCRVALESFKSFVEW